MCLEGKLDGIDLFWNLGVRVMQLSYNLPSLLLGGGKMSDAVKDQLAAAVEHRVGGKPSLSHTSNVRLDFADGRVWEGVIYVFDILGHATIQRAYAWPSAVEASQTVGTVRHHRRPVGAELRDVHVVLHLPSITSAKDAVRSVLGGR